MPKVMRWACLAVLTVWSGAAEACYCSGGSRSRADAIFTARTLSVGPRAATVRVLRVSKGRIAGIVSVSTSVGSCELTLRPGDTGLLKVKRVGRRYYTDRCLAWRGH